MSKHKLCTFRIGSCHMKVAIVPAHQWEELKQEYRGFEVSDIDYDQTEKEFFKLWPKGYTQRFHSELRPFEMIIEEF